MSGNLADNEAMWQWGNVAMGNGGKISNAGVGSSPGFSPQKTQQKKTQQKKLKETIPENMKPAQRQWFVDASCYDPESGCSVNLDSRRTILVKFLHTLGQQIWLALLPYLMIISEKVEQIRLPSNLALPTSTHSLEHSGRDRTGHAKVESSLSRGMLQPVQEDVFKAHEISEVFSKTRDQFVYKNKMLAYYRKKLLDIQARKQVQATTSDMV
eukprot:gene10317-8248_t